MQRQTELERFKTEINLVEYAEAKGYEIDHRESSRASTVMRRGDDKIIVATSDKGHGIYFSVRDPKDNGTVIDFAQKREGLTLGQVRLELRPWVGGSGPQLQRKPQAQRPPRPEPSPADRVQILAIWTKMGLLRPGRGLAALARRGISADTLDDPRFRGMVRTDAKGNAVFPHYDTAGLAGYELKNEGFTGFSRGGTKALWHSANIHTSRRLVLVESAIDALSHAQLHQDPDAAYISTGGSMSEHQRELVRAMLASAAGRGASIALATDRDKAGDALAAQLHTLAPPGADVRRETPQAKDWNDQLVLGPDKPTPIPSKSMGLSR